MDKKTVGKEHSRIENKYVGKTECSWCKAAGLGEADYMISFDQIAGFDKLLGKPVCRGCMDSAFTIERLLFGLQEKVLYSKAV